MRVAAVIPAYDAARTVAEVVHETKRAWGDLGVVYVVDDGSTDATAERGHAAGAEVVFHRENRGKGSAIRTGLERALRDGHAAAVTLDADGQHPPREAARLAQLPGTDDAMVLGVRDLRGAGAPRPNRISNAISNGFLSIFSRRLLTDTQCGLRRYPLPSAIQLGGRDDGYALREQCLEEAL